MKGGTYPSRLNANYIEYLAETDLKIIGKVFKPSLSRGRTPSHGVRASSNQRLRLYSILLVVSNGL